MIRSMTGFGQAETCLDGRRLTAEIKSFNHRYLEVSVRLPAPVSPFEQEIRRMITERFDRGKVELTIRMETDVAAKTGLVLNLPLARAYAELVGRMRNELGLSGEVTVEMVAAFRDVVRCEEPAGDSEALKRGIEGVIGEAVANLSSMREKEGMALRQDMSDRLASFGRHVDAVDARAPAVVEEYRRRLNQRIRDLMTGAVPDEARIAQEVAILADRSDVTEEIVRLRSHMGQFREMLGHGDAVGRKMDFLLQEMNRETNTIGSKSNDAEMATHVVEMKSVLAKIREQVQNIE